MKIPTPASDKARHLGLDSHSDAMAEAAEQAIREMGPEAIPFLLQVIEEQRHVCRQQNKVLKTAGFVILSLVCLVLSIPAPRTASFKLIINLVTIPLCAAWIWLFSAKPSRLSLHAKRLFAQLADKQDLGTLVELMAQGGSEEVVRAITQLLPQLMANDAGLLLPGHRKILAGRLHYYHSIGPDETAFTIALLGTLQQIGDGSFVAPVTKLAQMTEYGSKDPVKVAAEACLPYLLAFAEQEQKGGTLVRAATAPDNEQAHALLLRPAGTTPQTEESTLLVRSVEEGE